MDVHALISNVQSTPEIWDTRLKLSSNRFVINRCWKQIANEMGADEISLRRKWKYLRDQFAVEFGKRKLSIKSSDPGETPYKTKWPYFKLLYFLKDVVRPRGISGNLSTSINGQTSDADINYVESNYIESQNKDDEQNESDEDNEHTVDQDEFSIFHKNKKRCTYANVKYHEALIEMKKRKIECMEQVLEDRLNENDDLLFFKSLMPHVNKIPDNMKLRFRSRIQEIVDDFAYPDET